MGENEEGKEIEMEARLPGRVAQELEVQAGRSELGRGRDGGTQAGIRCLRRRKKRRRETLERRRFRAGPHMGAKQGREKKRRGDNTGSTAYPRRRRPIRRLLATRSRGIVRVLHADDADGARGGLAPP